MKRIQKAILAALVAAAPLCGSGRFSTIYEYAGGNPTGFPISSGAIYGTASGASPGVNNGCGAVFQLVPPSASGAAWGLEYLYGFRGSGDGCDPVFGLAAGDGGDLYGVAGVVYELQPPRSPGGAWTENVLYGFPGTGAADPFTAIPLPDGSVYAATSGAGANDAGGLYHPQPPSTPGDPWTTTVAYSFPNDRRKAAPTYPTLGSDGAFYGAISGGDSKDYCGAVFKLERPTVPGGRWKDTILHGFRGLDDGVTPNSVTLGPDGVLYGTTFGDSEFCYGTGTVFSLTPPASPGGKWTRSILHTFSNRKAAANYPYGPDSPLVMRNGKLYGASGLFDTHANTTGGVVFEMSPPTTPGGRWATTIPHRWRNGQVPVGAIAMDRNGTIYGGTYLPNTASGTIYRIKLP